MRFRLFLAGALTLAGGAIIDAGVRPVSAATSDVLISEYVEGSSLNKAIEIYNGTGAPVDLAAGGYELRFFFNGSTSAGTTIPLTGTIADGDVHVVADDGAVPAITDVADQLSTSNFFNGDDAVALLKGGTIVDVFGQVGVDPGSQWGAGDTGAQNNTLRRLASVCDGDTNQIDAFDPATEWEGLGNDVFDGLGAHTANCGDGGGGPGDPTAVINEFVANHTGSDTNEYVEVFGPPSTDLSALTVLQLEGDTSTGTIDSVIPVGTTDASGLWVSPFLSNEFENGTITLLLVEDFTGADGDDLDTDDDGALDVTPWTAVVDAVAVTDGDAADLTYGVPVLAPGFGGSPFTPGGASRIPDGADTDAVADWVVNNFFLAGIPGFGDSANAGEALNTPGAPNALYEPPPTGECGAPATYIHEIQGAGFTSPLLGESVVIEGVVVGDHQDDVGADGDLNGFFVQEEDGDQDGDPATSEGIFVFEGSNPAIDLAKGDVVRVLGIADEFFGMTQVDTVQGILVCDTGVSVTPAELTLPVTSDADFERIEGMSVVAGVDQDLVISEFFNFDRFGEIVLTTDRQYQPTAIFDPGTAEAAALADLNARSRITLDDGLSSQNPDPARHPNGDPFALDNRFRGGDVLNDVAGVVNYSFSLYRIQPTAGATYTEVNERPDAPDAVGGDVTVAAFNVLNYFNTIDDDSLSGDDPDRNICGPDQDQGCRGADSVEERDRQLAKIVAAMTTIDADVLGIIEVENTTGVEAMADIVGALNAGAGFDKYAYVDTGTVGSDAIKVGLIYQPAVVSPSGAYAVLDDPAFVAPFGVDRNRAALAQTFVENATGAEFTVAVNHLKSKGSPCGPGDDTDETGSCNLTRTVSAQVLADWLAGDPTGSGDPDVMIVGDLNSYDMEDPIDVLKDAGYTDLLDVFGGPEAYTYVFDGQLGHLDYAMSNSSMTPQVTGTTAWNINADEPDLLDYDTTFKQDAQDAIYAPDAYRSSDHDPVIVGLDLNAPPVCTAAEPSVATLWAPNHEFVDVEVLGVVDPDGDPVTITIDSIAQDEEVRGKGSGNTGPDGAGIGTSVAQVRAERAGNGDGRVYEIGYTATDSAGNSCSGTVVVTVPKSQDGAPAIDSGDRYDSTVG